MSKYGFSVDEHSDDETARKVLLQLKRMARLGKVAERALKEIEEKGFCNRQLPVAFASKDSWKKQADSSYICTHDISHVKFRKREDISRADLGPMDQIHIEFGGMRDGHYSAFSNKEAPLLLRGPFRRQINVEGELETQELSVEVGKVRINKSHLSFVEGTYSGKTHQVYKAQGVSPHALVAYKGMAECFVKAIVDTTPGISMSARTHDLRTTAPQWLVEDGHIERLCQEIHKTIRVLEVMEA